MKKAVTITLLFLIGAILLFAPSSPTQAQSGLYIYQVTLQGSFTQIENATVGAPVNLIATISTPSGSYRVWLGDELVDSGNAEGYYVSSNFTIPEVVGGYYTLTLNDVAQGANATYPFPILTEYSAKPTVPSLPALLQEGSNVLLNVTVTGGEASTAYDAEIMVMQPAPVNANYTTVVSFTTSSKGTAQAQITYPEPSFSPSGSSTLYAGTYNVYYNRSMGLAIDSFTVGFTDLTQYHRQDTVKINALGYQPGQGATVAIQSDNVVISSQVVTASDQGVIAATWPVSSNAAIGKYTVTISPQTTPSKAVGDVQDFEIIGYPVAFTAVNLAGELVPDILVEAFDQASGKTYSATTDINGFAKLNLEKGAHTVNVFWNEVKVGETQVPISGSQTSTVTCQLTDLKIKVQDKNGIVIPFVDLRLTFQYVDRTGAARTGNASGQTDLLGIFALNSTLPQISYTVEASKYDKVFNAGNGTISSLPAQPLFQVNIVCPDEALTLRTIDYNNVVLPNARITLIEQASGIFYSVNTGSSGEAQIRVTFGQYRVNVYTADNVLLNETVINVLSNTESNIRCVQYNLDVSVKVVDFFGNPISNVNVQLSRTGTNTQSTVTGSDGTAPFPNVIGGNIEVIAYPAGNPNSYVAANIQVDSPATVKLNLDKYVSVGGALIETSMFATVLIILLVVLLLVGLQVYMRLGLKLVRRRES